MSIRLTPIQGFRTTAISFHPAGKRGMCVRAEHDGVMMIWDSGYRKYPYRALPAHPVDQVGQRLPVKLARPLLASMSDASVVDVAWL